MAGMSWAVSSSMAVEEAARSKEAANFIFVCFDDRVKNNSDVDSQEVEIMRSGEVGGDAK